MIKLTRFGRNFESAHVRSLAPYIRSRLKELKVRAKPNTLIRFHSIDILIVELLGNIEGNLLANPTEMRELISRIDHKFPDLKKVLMKAPKNFDEEEKDLIGLLRWVYDYDRFSDEKISWGAYALVNLYELRICPYCQTSHINYHDVDALKMRPALDHFFPRSIYPYLGICLYNLIPSCYQCNSSIKSNKDPILAKVPHPLEFCEEDVHFRIKDPKGHSAHSPTATVRVEITTKSEAAENHVIFFKLRERYEWYAHEFADAQNRVAQLRDASGSLQRMLEHSNFMYGFPPAKANHRLLGRCVKDIVDSLATSYSP